MSRPADIAVRLLPWLALATAAVAATRFFGDALWPCPVSCQGGGHYQRLWGVPVHVPAVAVLLAVAALAWAGRRREAAWLAWAAAGASFYFLWLAWMLALRCPYCFAVHTGVLATAAMAALAAGRPWLPRLALAVLAFLGLHFAFHPGVVADGPAPAGPEIGAFLAPVGAPAAAAVDPALDQLRRQGSPRAAYVLELAIDLHCPHCAAVHAPLQAALRQAVAAGRVEVVQRFLTRPSAPSARELAQHVLAARDAAQAALLTSLLLGTPEGRGWAAVRPRIGEIADPAALEASLATRGPAIDSLLDADAARLRQLRVVATPCAVLSRRGGAALARWDERSFDPAAIAREIPLE